MSKYVLEVSTRFAQVSILKEKFCEASTRCILGWSESYKENFFSRIFNWLGVQNLCMDTSSASVKYLASSIMF